MTPRNTRVLVFATALMMAPILPVWSQPPVHRPQPAKKDPPKGEVIVKSDTPIDPNDTQAQSGQAPAQDQGAQATAPQGQTPPPGQAPPDSMQPAAPGQPATPPPASGMTAPNPNAAQGSAAEPVVPYFAAPPRGG